MISVSGTGSASGPPDVMRVRLAATAMRTTVAAALAASEEAARQIRLALRAAGVSPADAATAGLAVNAEQVWSEQTGPRITGYRSEHQLAITLRDLGSAGRSLGEAVAAGGDEVRLDGVSFEVEDDAPLRERARVAAWDDALRRARQLAELAGRELGEVREITEQSGYPVRPIGESRRAEAMATDVAVEPGAVDVQVTLAVQWALVPTALS
jgi:uncharacterized protein YggE